MSDNGNGPQDPWGDEKFQFKKPNIKLPGNMKIPGASAIIFVILVIYLGTGFFIVAPNEQAVVKRFGKVVRVVGPGPHYHMPMPIESIDKAEVTKVHRIEIGFRTLNSGAYREVPEESLMLTGDENIVSIETSLQYRITDISKYLYNVSNVEETIKDAAESAIREVAGREKIDDVLTTGKNRIQLETQRILQDMLDYYGTGITINAVQLQDVEPPKEVVESFKDVASAREDMNRFINEAQAYRNEIIPRARAEAETTILQAEAYQQEKIERARGDAQRFDEILVSYLKSPSITKKRLYFESMKDVYKNGEKYIFDASINNINPFIGLDSLKGQAQEAGK